MIFREYNKGSIFILLLLVITTLCSCKNSDQLNKKEELIVEANSFMNKSIQFAPLFHGHSNSLDLALWNRGNKIILYIDSLDCTSCTFNEIRRWNSYNKELERLNTCIVIICNSSDVKSINKVKEDMHLNYPIFLDTNQQFKLLNNISQKQMFQTFVVGSRNQVIWVGLPIRSEKTWKAFSAMIDLINIQK